MIQHRPRIAPDMALACCQASIAAGRASLKALNDLNPKLDGWKIKDHMARLVEHEASYNKFRPFAPGLDDIPFIQALGRPR